MVRHGRGVSFQSQVNYAHAYLQDRMHTYLPNPTYLPTHLPAYLPAYMPACMHAHIHTYA